MHYLTKTELRGLFQVVYNANRNHHLALVAALWHGMRVSELINLRGTDVTDDGAVIVRRLKGSRTTLQPVRRDDDPLFDETPIVALAQERKTLRLFPVSRQHFDRLIKQYGANAGIHPDKLHMHALKHSVAMLLWDATGTSGSSRAIWDTRLPALRSATWQRRTHVRHKLHSPVSDSKGEIMDVTANNIAEGICLAVERLAFGYFIVCALCYVASIARDVLKDARAKRRQAKSSFDLRSYIGMGK